MTQARALSESFGMFPGIDTRVERDDDRVRYGGAEQGRIARDD
jgi:hypothetical protein